LPELLAWRTEVAQELAQGADADGTLAAADQRRGKAEATCLLAGRALTKKRLAAAKEWSATLTRELKPLGFPHARIAFEVAQRARGAPRPRAWTTCS
ncbi:MAG: hypothetical protein K8R56_02515, partial [Candidatus Eisenbacteria bacterium]|nr:hypothetical protein [Candidatus Eisenbacteria bacterium]